LSLVPVSPDALPGTAVGVFAGVVSAVAAGELELDDPTAAVPLQPVTINDKARPTPATFRIRGMTCSFCAGW
jgi:hypothetical protein